MNATSTHTSPRFNLTSLLTDLATSSAMLRLHRKAIVKPKDRNPAAASQQDRLDVMLRYSMSKLGRLCQLEALDIRHGPFWTLLEHQDRYEASFEDRRAVDIEELTPRAIHEGLTRGNHLYWNDWQIYRGENEEITDDYGCPAWGAHVWLQSPDGTLTRFDGVSKYTARMLYEEIAGEPFAGVDNLGHDFPHPAEKRPWYVTGEGSGLWPFDPAMLPSRVHSGALA